MRLAQNPALKGTATLYADRVHIKCRSLLGSYKKDFPLSELESWNWWAGRGDANFAFYLKNGEDILVNLKGAGNWKAYLDEQAKEKVGQNFIPPVKKTAQEKALENLLKPLKDFDQ